MPDRILFIDEVAASLRTTESTVRYWIATKNEDMPKYAKIGRRIVFRQSDVDAWLNAKFADTNGPAS